METPHSEHFDDIYFAVEDGLAESRYVFLDKNNLPERWMGKERFVIAETGFGTGLNFLCAWTAFEESASETQRLHYYSFEKFPLSASEIHKYLAHWSAEFSGRLERLVELYPLRVGGWHTIRVSDRVTITLIFDDVNRALPELDTLVDCWFLDGHAPAKNPDMWSETVFRSIGRLSRKGARFATFTAAGFVRRSLQDVGFHVEKTRGFGRKRDMSVGVFERENHDPVSGVVSQRVAVIGGGIAGASVAAALAHRAVEVTLFEKAELAADGSGNIRGLCNPKFTAQRGIEADLYSSAFALMQRVLSGVSQVEDIGYVPCGSLHLMTDEAKEKRYRKFPEAWGWHEDHAQILEAEGASGVCGVPVSKTALFLPDAAMVSPRLAVAYLARSAARVVYKSVDQISQQADGWLVDGEVYDSVVIANGFGAQGFEQLAPFFANAPLQRIRGQVTRVQETTAYQRLKTNLCYGGYSTIPFSGEVVVGSTFQHWIDSPELRPEDNEDNLRKLAEVFPDLAEGLEVVAARAGFRCAAKDRFPIIGAVPGQDGLYVSIAHGSHGILSGLMGGEILAAILCGEPQNIPRSLERGLSLSRFIKAG